LRRFSGGSIRCRRWHGVPPSERVMDSNITSLMSKISFWETWGYVALGGVLVGVIGESIKEFTNWPERIGWEKKIGRLSALVLIAGLAGKGLTQPSTNAANAKLVAFVNKEAAQLQTDLQKEREYTAARSWKKEQFDAIQAIHDKVKDVGVIPEKDCLECHLFAEDIQLAFHAAGAQLYGDDSLGDVVRGTGIAVRLPIGADLTNDPLIVALRNAGLNPFAMFHLPSAMSPTRVDIPIIFVGEKFPQYAEFPYSPTGSSQWTVLPLRNPNFVGPPK
jgi:hypothetical protein